MTSTKKIIDFLVEEFQRDNGIDLSSDKMAMQRLKDAAEKLRKTYQVFLKHKSAYHSFLLVQLAHYT